MHWMIKAIVMNIAIIIMYAITIGLSIIVWREHNYISFSFIVFVIAIFTPSFISSFRTLKGIKTK